jgi:tetratricopeptide (TPR) repeat protein
MVALAAMTLVVYLPTMDAGFLKWDDQLYVTGNTHVLAGLTWQGIWWALTTSHSPYWHPLTWLSHMTDVELFGLNAGAHHMVSVAIHALNALLLFALLRSATRSLWRSALVAAIFAVHPLHVESVAWIAERKDVLSVLFSLLALRVYVAYVHSGIRACFWAVVALFVAAVMCKPMAVTLPLVILLLDFWPLGRFGHMPAGIPANGPRSGTRAVWLEKLPLLMVAGVVSAATVLVQWKVGAVAQLDVFPLPSRLANAVVSYGAYLGSALWPVHLSAFYPWPPEVEWSRVLISAAVLVTVTLAAVVTRRRHPFVLVGWLWFLVTLAPVIGLIQVGEQARADRFMYFPLVGLSIIAAWGCDAIASRVSGKFRMTIPVVATSALLACIVTSRIQAGYWRDDVTLWSHAAKVTESNYLAHDLLGLAHKDRGEWDAALASYQAALSVSPARQPEFSALVHNNIAFVLVHQGRLPDAIGHYRRAIAIEPDLPEAHLDLGATLVMAGKPAEAVPHYRQAIRLQPGMAPAHNGLGAALALQGYRREAIAEYREAIRLDPTLALAEANLGAALAQERQLAESARSFVSALQLEPDNPRWQYQAGVVFAAMKQTPQAIQHLEKALELDGELTDAAEGLAALRSGRPWP